MITTIEYRKKKRVNKRNINNIINHRLVQQKISTPSTGSETKRKYSTYKATVKSKFQIKIRRHKLYQTRLIFDNTLYRLKQN